MSKTGSDTPPTENNLQVDAECNQDSEHLKAD